MGVEGLWSSCGAKRRQQPQTAARPSALDRLSILADSTLLWGPPCIFRCISDLPLQMTKNRNSRIGTECEMECGSFYKLRRFKHQTTKLLNFYWLWSALTCGPAALSDTLRHHVEYTDSTSGWTNKRHVDPGNAVLI